MNNKEIFEKINEILLKDLKPSKNLKNLIIDGYLDKEPFNKIKKLNDIPPYYIMYPGRDKSVALKDSVFSPQFPKYKK